MSRTFLELHSSPPLFSSTVNRFSRVVPPPSREEKEKAEIKRRLARDVGHENEFRPRRKLHEFGIHPRGGGDSEGGKCVYPDAKWICLGPVDTVTVVDECATFQTQFPRPCSGEGCYARTSVRGKASPRVVSRRWRDCRSSRAISIGHVA